MILTYQAHKCSPEGICFTLREYIPLIKVWTCGPVLWSVGWGVSRRYCRSCSCSRSHKIYICSNKIKLGSTYAYHALWPLSYHLDKIQDRDKRANRCNGGIIWNNVTHSFQQFAVFGQARIVAEHTQFMLVSYRESFPWRIFETMYNAV